MAGKLKFELELLLGNSIYEAKQFERAIQGIGASAAASGKSFKQLEFEQAGIVRQLRGLKTFSMPSDAWLRERSQKMLASVGQIPAPPVTPPPIPTNMRLAGLGVASGMFSPWIGATALNQSGILGGGTAGGALNRILGGAGLSGFAAAYLGLQVASRALKSAFDSLRESVKSSAQLFFDASRLRTSPGQLMEKKTILKALGIPESQDLLQQLAYGKGGSMSTKNMAALIGASGQQGTVSYMQWIARGDKAFWDQMANNSRNFHVLWTAFGYQMERLSSTLTGEFLPALNQFLLFVNKLGPALSKLVEWASKVFKSIPAIAGLGGLGDMLVGGAEFGKGNQGAFGAGVSWNRIHQSMYEKMGFVAGNVPAAVVPNLIRRTNEILTQIARNTGLTTPAEFDRQTTPQLP